MLTRSSERILKFKYKCDQEGEKTHISVKTTGLCSIEMTNSGNYNYNIMLIRFSKRIINI